MSCINCGECCRFIELDIKGVTEDLEKWFNLHNMIIYEGKLIIPIQCEWLKGNNCMHYKLRPDICKGFKVDGESCQRAKKIMKMFQKKKQ